MALRVKTDWLTYFTDIGIPAEAADAYADSFVTNRITDALLPRLTEQYLTTLGVTAVGDILLILGNIASIAPAHMRTTPASTTAQVVPPKPHYSAKPPSILPSMTHPQFRKFRIDWNAFKQLSNIPNNQLVVQLYSLCDDSVQNSLINSVNEVFSETETALLDQIEKIVTKHSNPTVHRMTFGNIIQSPTEPIQDYLVRLKSAAVDCEFSCPNCQHDLNSTHVKDQFIRGLYNSTLQTDILAKASHLISLNDIVKHAEAFETALHDHLKLNESNDLHISRISDYKRSNVKSSNTASTNKPCSGCGNTNHSNIERSKKCPAWGKLCLNCQIPNHFAKVCRKPHKLPDSAALLAHVSHKPAADAASINEIDAQLKPHGLSHFTNIKIFPDSGASICLAGPSLLSQLRFPVANLIPCKKLVTAVGGSTLSCDGWLPITFKISNFTTTQPLFICKNVTRVYLSKRGCLELNILPTTFPYPMPSPNLGDTVSAVTTHSEQTEKSTPHRPCSLPYPATEANIPKLEQFLREKFQDTAFNKGPPFPAMKTPPVHIHLKQNAKPYAIHTPIPIPHHWKKQVKESLDADVAKGIISPVPVGTPTTWCSQMLVIPKKDGSPRRVVDLQNLNSQCLRETHPTASPFQLASQIPPNTYKTVLDAVDGYHAIPLDEESRFLTTFLTEYGRYMYNRVPQGFIAAGDAYTRRYDEIIKTVERKLKIVDDTLLYDQNIESAFFHTWDYLQRCAENGIVIHSEKFQFCRKSVLFAGLQITPSGIEPSQKILSAIADFPTPKDITGARSWFGLVNQVAWAYAISNVMLPFRNLVKPSAKFYWDESLDKLFADSKAVLKLKVKEGVQMFDINRRTCLQCDFSKDGIGYLLLQQYCDCNLENAPVCCPDGWRLVYAGSRFTTQTESRYSPTEGEALAITWALQNARTFIFGCPNLIIVTDHKPLISILSDRHLNTIVNPRLLKFKEKTLSYRFKIQYCPGKWLRGPDACSRNPALNPALKPSISAILTPLRPLSTVKNLQDAEIIEDSINSVCLFSLFDINNNSENQNHFITYEMLREESMKDKSYQELCDTVKSGFPTSALLTPSSIRNFWEVRERLSCHENIVLLDDRIVIPHKFRKSILQNLHSAHQSSTTMIYRAQKSMYWPKMAFSIKQFYEHCSICKYNAPSQRKETLLLSPSPSWPFQQIASDYFFIENQTYLIVVDRFSGWPIVYHCKSGHATSESLISICREIFTSYGSPEEFSSDGGPQYVSSKFQQFLTDWGVKHRISSVSYPQSNGRAEAAVKSIKRIITYNTSRGGSLDNNKFSKAMLQYRNTPLSSINLSPAQILFHRKLRDHTPENPKHYHLHSNWVLLSQQREEHASKQKHIVTEKYNSSAHDLSPLDVGATVLVQNKSNANGRYNKWDRAGKIVEVLPFRQYRIRLTGSGNITLRNRRFIRKCETIADNINISPYVKPSDISLPYDDHQGGDETEKENENLDEPLPLEPSVSEHLPQNKPKISRALKCLQPYNNPGLKE